MTVADLQGTASVVAGSLDQEEYALDASTGATLPGWPLFTSDSVFSTAAVGDLYGTGSRRDRRGRGPDRRLRRRPPLPAGRPPPHRQPERRRHLRLRRPPRPWTLRPRSGPSCRVAPRASRWEPGAFFAGATDTDAVKAFDTDCDQVWSRTLDGATTSSPALADVTGTGRLAGGRGHRHAGTGGSVWVLDGATGATVWQAPVVGRVIGSVVVADLAGTSSQDVLVPTTAGVEILDGASGTELTVLSPDLGFQNSPLVTDDPNGDVGITVAGYDGTNQGEIRHYEILGSDGAVGHRRRRRGRCSTTTPSAAGVTGTAPHRAVVPVPSGALPGYTLAAGRRRGVRLRAAPFCGSAGGLRCTHPVVGMATAPGSRGLLARGGGRRGLRLRRRPVLRLDGRHGAGPTDGRHGGHPRRPWLLAGRRPTAGCSPSATPATSARCRTCIWPPPWWASPPSVDGAGLLAGRRPTAACSPSATPSTSARWPSTDCKRRWWASPSTSPRPGYWLVAADGGVFGFGAHVLRLAGRATPWRGRSSAWRRPTTGTATGLVGADGGVFAFGDAPFDGSMAQTRLAAPVRADRILSGRPAWVGEYNAAGARRPGDPVARQSRRDRCAHRGHHRGAARGRDRVGHLLRRVHARPG